ncbi:hypothetical protein CA13_35270 [Planctomycetes bacterium CA13]|uniref:Uncharacterized protein n=1 Tax=Novipirellula herctigrandis TaxID=2527986 RepID=A0A5C5Z3W7_9BACT|nr:hypothetical protein CA13_35270 [Planctomycetes bacterium CA13]
MHYGNSTVKMLDENAQRTVKTLDNILKDDRIPCSPSREPICFQFLTLASLLPNCHLSLREITAVDALLWSRRPARVNE